jgi:predicted RNA binding protein YcfA (HicA-like mRNA interferase family)
MKMPRELSAKELISVLKKLGYRQIQQTGSHARFFHSGLPDHKITIPITDKIKVGTLNAILNEVAKHLKIDKQDLIKLL